MTEIRTISGLELRDGRVLVGVVVPYDVDTRIGRYTERFTRGAFSDADPDLVPLLAAHDHGALPIGRTVELTEEARGLIGTFHVAETPKGEEVLALARDGVPLGLSVGFRPRPGGDRWNPGRTHVTRTAADLAEVSVVGVAAYADARVEDVRSARFPVPHLCVGNREPDRTPTPLAALARRLR